MPRLPDVEARPTPRPGRPIASYEGGALARAIGSAGETLGKLAEEYSLENDRQAVFEARRKLDEWERSTLYDPQAGAVTRLGREAFGLPDEIPKSFDAATAEIAKGLRSERQRRTFGELAASRREQALSFVDRHVLQQRNVFNEQQFVADLNASRERAAMIAVVDPNRVDAELGVMQLRIVGRGNELGRPKEWIAEAVRDNTSQVHLAAVNSMLEANKPLEAQEYLKKRGSGMKFDDFMKAQHSLNQQLDSLVAFGKADAAVRKHLPGLVPTDGERLMNLAGEPKGADLAEKLTPLVRQAESGGRQYGKDGKILEGPMTKYGTAKGDMQVLDSTARAPGLGVTPARDDSPEERSRVGRDYLKALLVRYDGDIAKSLAAYNWGMGNVDQAVARAGARPGGDWFVFAPAETRNYVQKIVRQFETGGGKPTEPTIADVHNALRADPELSGNPRRLKVALEQATAQWGDVQKAKKETEDTAYANAVRELLNNGGKFSLLSAATLRAVPAEKLTQLISAAETIAQPLKVSDPMLVYQMTTYPERLKTMPENEFVALLPRLTPADQKHFAELRAPKKPGDPKDLDQAAVNATLNMRLTSIGIDPTPKDSEKSKMEHVGAVRRFVADSVLAAQTASGKKFTDADIAKHIDELMVQSRTFRTFLLGTETTKLLAMKYSDLPSDTIKVIKADLLAQGNAAPSEGEILAAYYKAATSANRKVAGVVR